ncbi:MAG TPA: hypothetical protein VGB23_05845 [Nitrospirota bacterium]
MFRLFIVCMSVALFISFLPAVSHADQGLVSETGNLLKGTVYKKTGIEREGIITIKTKWRLPAVSPVYRFDFDMIYGQVEGSLYSFIVGDVAEMEFLPSDDNQQVISITLRDGLVHKLTLTSDKKALLGPVKLWMDEVRVLTDSYGENIIPASEVGKIVFYPPATIEQEDMPALVDGLKKAVEVGVRDDLVDEDLATVLENIQKKMKARMQHEKGRAN